MDKERIVGASPHWDKLKDIFHAMGLTVSHKSSVTEYVSHGVLIIINNEGLFLQMSYTYEYQCILRGAYTGAKLYHYLSLITQKERELLLCHPFEQWRSLYPSCNMPGDLYRKFCTLQKYLPLLYMMIPLDGEPPSHLQTDDAKSLSTDSVQCSYLLTIPKGRAEEGESSKDAACRELQEETGIELDSKALSLSATERYIGTDGNLYTTYIYAAFLDEYPKVTLGQEFKGYIWLSSNENVLLRRQLRILQTFLTDVNERHTKQICRRHHRRWVEQIWQVGQHSPRKATTEPSRCPPSSTGGKSTDDQKHVQYSHSSRDECIAVQSITGEDPLPPEPPSN